MVEILIALIILILAVIMAPILRYSFRALRVKYLKLKTKFIYLLIEYIFLKKLTRAWIDEWMFERELQFVMMKLTVENWMFRNVLPRKWCSFYGWYCPNPDECDYEHFDEPQPAEDGFIYG